MNFLDGMMRGASQAATGGDGKMDLSDYLKMGALAASVATGNVPGAIALGSSYLGDATGSEALSTVGDVASMATGIGGIANMASGAASAASAAGAATDVASTAASAGAQGAGMLASNVATPLLSAVPSTVATPFATSANLLQASTPAAFSGAAAGAETAGNVFDAASKANNGGSQFKLALNAVLGDGSGAQKFEKGVDLATQVNDAYSAATAGPPGGPTPTPPPAAGTFDMSAYIPQGTTLSDLRSQAGATPSPYAAQYSNVYGG